MFPALNRIENRIFDLEFIDRFERVILYGYGIGDFLGCNGDVFLAVPSVKSRK